MKNVNFFIITLFAFFSFVFSQSQYSQNKWSIKIRSHDVNYYPIIKSPFRYFFYKRNNSLNPFFSDIEIVHHLTKNIGLYVNGTLGMVDNNRWKIMDSFFIKFNPGINLHLFPKYRIDPYLILGGGYHQFNYENSALKVSVSDYSYYYNLNQKHFILLDGGVGMNLWVVSNVGVNLQSTYNHILTTPTPFIAEAKEDFLNFWDHSMGLVFRFGNSHSKKKEKGIYSSDSTVVKEEEEKEKGVSSSDSTVVKEEKEKEKGVSSSDSTVVKEEEEKEKGVSSSDSTVVKEEEEKENNLIEENSEEEEKDTNCCEEILDQDQDQDGILDKYDFCPDQFGLKKFNGCPDTDSDNIPDHEDKCPKKFGLKKFNGCPDTRTTRTTTSRTRKISSSNKSNKNIILKPILFKFGQPTLSSHSRSIINEIAVIMTKRLPHSKFYINGCTDDSGKNSFNKALSLKRAKCVFEALKSKGISPYRMKIRGLVKCKSIKNDKGRRVDIVVIQTPK
ncbi:OmpA family protein [Blattabacterium cuenoti]|uniref:OmpA family protein n=1 Tax=Blattabacterium cuenoti TaxID=1653831 RepID=UPI00163C4FCE|nr:OmpA family protein [Blattabacterium cuenoti]